MEHLGPKTELTAQIVGAYVGHNPVSAADLPGLISAVHGALASLGKLQVAEVAERPVPAVPIKRSVTPDHLICLEDGKKLKMLKRHLATAYDMTAEQYRAKWGLPVDYPMVAPAYAAKRSAVAKASGLGRKKADG